MSVLYVLLKQLGKSLNSWLQWVTSTYWIPTKVKTMTRIIWNKIFSQNIGLMPCHFKERKICNSGWRNNSFLRFLSAALNTDISSSSSSKTLKSITKLSSCYLVGQPISWFLQVWNMSLVIHANIFIIYEIKSQINCICNNCHLHLSLAGWFFLQVVHISLVDVTI